MARTQCSTSAFPAVFMSRATCNEATAHSRMCSTARSRCVRTTRRPFVRRGPIVVHEGRPVAFRVLQAARLVAVLVPAGRRSCCPRPRILTCWLKTAPHFSLLPPFLPVMMFAILFGLSMDYEVFLVSRIREAFLGQAQPGEAVVDGVARTANVITAAAAIMVAVFGAFVLSPDLNLKLVGAGLASAILSDATIVRMLLVPATME